MPAPAIRAVVAGLWGMWVDPRARGMGVGERLVNAVHEWADARGARTLRLGALGGEGGTRRASTSA